MAGSKTYKIGTIFSRTTGLLKAGGRKWEDKPLWYDVWEAFPPKIEPNFGRPEPTEEINPIFYSEDVIRAKFYAEFGSVGLMNLSETSRKPTLSQLFIEEYSRLKQNTNLPEDEIWTEVVTLLESRGIRLRPGQQDVADNSKGLKLSELFSEAEEHEETQKTKISEFKKDVKTATQSGAKLPKLDLDDVFSEDISHIDKEIDDPQILKLNKKLISEDEDKK